MAGTRISWLLATVALNLPRRRRPRRNARGGRPLLGAVGLLILLSGALVMATSLALRGVVVEFGVSIAVAVAAAVATVVSWARSTRVDAVVSMAMLVLAAWTVVATAWTFTPDTARWIAFGSGLGYMALGVVALLLHERRTLRVVHVLDVRQSPG